MTSLDDDRTLTLFGRILLTLFILSFIFAMICLCIPSIKDAIILGIPFLITISIFIAYFLLKVLLLIWGIEITWLINDLV